MGGLLGGILGNHTSVNLKGVTNRWWLEMEAEWEPQVALWGGSSYTTTGGSGSWETLRKLFWWSRQEMFMFDWVGNDSHSYRRFYASTYGAEFLLSQTMRDRSLYSYVHSRWMEWTLLRTAPIQISIAGSCLSASTILYLVPSPVGRRLPPQHAWERCGKCPMREAQFSLDIPALPGVLKRVDGVVMWAMSRLRTPEVRPGNK